MIKKDKVQFFIIIAKNSTFYKYKTIIFEQARKNRAEM